MLREPENPVEIRPRLVDGGNDAATIIVGESPTVGDGSSNTVVIGEQPPADADLHVHRHYGSVRPPSYGEPFNARMTIVRLNCGTTLKMSNSGLVSLGTRHCRQSD
jgi:hypothetical protein